MELDKINHNQQIKLRVKLTTVEVTEPVKVGMFLGIPLHSQSTADNCIVIVSFLLCSRSLYVGDKIR
jgi:hypothetical protein